MSPRRPRRRARRRSPARPIILVAVVLVLAALLIGGLAEVSRQSAGYDATSNRTLAAQGTVVARQSNATASSVTALLNVLQSQNRPGLQIALDNLVQQSAVESTRARAAASATPLGSVGSEFTAVFADRARSMSQLRAAIDGYLGMQPMAVAGSPDGAPSSSAGDTTLLSAAQATNRIAAAGALLEHSDSLYGSVRRALAAAAGHGRLPKSAWVSNPALWGPDNIAAQIDLLSTTPSLAATHWLALRTVRIDPPALPTPQGVPANVSVISPTTQVSVDAVLGNNGTVDEPHATVHFTLADQTSGATANRTETVSLASAASQVLPIANFRVKPGTTYVLTVSVELPPGQTETAGTAIQQDLQIAPGT